MSEGEQVDDQRGVAETLDGDVRPRLGRSPDRHMPEVFDDRYELLGLVGSGAVGNVYKAVDNRLGEVIALKTLDSRLTGDDRVLERFRREAKLARRVTHKNVARTYDFGEGDGVPYITMEYLSGESLAERIRRQAPVPPKRAVRCMLGVCEGLKAAHDAGVIHRDLKPGNVFITEDGRVVVADFGLASPTFEDDFSERITGGDLIGTPAYMAPEQIRGPDEVDERADIYSAGTILFEMLCGEPHLDHENVAALTLAKLVEEPPDLAEKNPDVPTELSDLVAKCLEREPAARFDSAEKLASALSRWAPEPDAAAPVASSSDQSARDVESLKEVVSREPRRTKSVLVPEFRNEAGEEFEYLTGSLTAELTDRMSERPSLEVVPLDAFEEISREEYDPEEFGREVDADVVVTGVIRAADAAEVQLEVSAHSVDEGFELWSERFSSEVGDLLEVARQSARAISATLLMESPSATGSLPSDSEAVEWYLRARDEMHDHWYGDLSNARALLERALEKVPGEPRVLTALATVRGRMGHIDTDRRLEHIRQAKRLARRVVNRHPDWSPAWLALAAANFQDYDLKASIEAIRKVVRRQPNNAVAYDLLGCIILEVGPIREGLELLRSALRIDRRRVRARLELARAHAMNREAESVRRLLDQQSERSESDTNRILTHLYRVRYQLWGVLPTIEEEALEFPADHHTLMWTRAMREAAERGAITDAHLEELRETAREIPEGSRRRILYWQHIAEIAAAVGRVEDAIEALGRTVESGLRDKNWLESCPLFEEFQSQTRFRLLLERVRGRADPVLRAYRKDE